MLISIESLLQILILDNLFFIFFINAAPNDGLPEYSNEIDWSQLADDAAQNADLDVTEHLPPPPEVIEIDDDTDYVYVPPVTPFIKQ